MDKQYTIEDTLFGGKGHANKNGQDDWVDSPSAIDVIIKHALQKYPHIFTHDEIELMRKVMKLPKSAKYLFLRLYKRKGPWIRADQVRCSQLFTSKVLIIWYCALGWRGGSYERTQAREACYIFFR